MQWSDQQSTDPSHLIDNGNLTRHSQIMLACSKLGAYFTLFNYAYTAAELLATVKATTPRVLLTTLSTSRFDYRCVLDEIVRQTPELERVILLDDASVAFEVKEKYIQDGTNRFLEYSKMLKSGRSRSSLTNTGPEEMDTDILNLQFTSGSTGTPKVAALTHHGMVNSAIYMGQTMTLTSSDKIVVPVPLFHAFGLIMGKYIKRSWVNVDGESLAKESQDSALPCYTVLPSSFHQNTSTPRTR